MGQSAGQRRVQTQNLPSRREEIVQTTCWFVFSTQADTFSEEGEIKKPTVDTERVSSLRLK